MAAPGGFNARGGGVVRTVVVVVVVVVVLIVLTECTRFVVGKLLNSVVGTVSVSELASLVDAIGVGGTVLVCAGAGEVIVGEATTPGVEHPLIVTMRATATNSDRITAIATISAICLRSQFLFTVISCFSNFLHSIIQRARFTLPISLHRRIVY